MGDLVSVRFTNQVRAPLEPDFLVAEAGYAESRHPAGLGSLHSGHASSTS